MTPPRSRDTTDRRLTRLETGIESIGKGLTEFVQESRDFRRHQEGEQDKIWGAINQQNASRAITWPMIFAAITVLVTVIGAATKVSDAFNGLRVRIVEIQAEHNREEILRMRDLLEKK